MKKFNTKTPAKINLMLEILGKRTDGFHEIASIMQAVSLFDHITISAEDGTEAINLSGNSLLIPYNEENIAYKAAKLFLEKTGITNQNINIYIKKNIPVAAGLAGGSSDAAAMLKGLNELYDFPLCAEEMHALAAKLGSDVNFCIEGGTCIATGRGEKIKQIPTPDLKIVLIKPKNLFISAKEAYQRYEKLDLPEKKFNPDNISTPYKLFNDLEKAIMPAYPEISHMKKLLTNIGCKNVLMSGSGPTVFGVYDGEIDISNLPESYEVFKAHSIKSDSWGVSA